MGEVVTITGIRDGSGGKSNEAAEPFLTRSRSPTQPHGSFVLIFVSYSLSTQSCVESEGGTPVYALVVAISAVCFYLHTYTVVLYMLCKHSAGTIHVTRTRHQP